MAQVKGTVAPAFDAVREEFERNLVERGELGASYSVTHDGETVVDLWGGIADESTGGEWTEDSLSVVYSVSKAMAASCVHKLIAAGELELDARIEKYWPEFAQNGKRDITVRMALAQTAHVELMDQPLPDGIMFDWDVFIEHLAKQAPLNPPGLGSGYHGQTAGHLYGELVRRVTGTTVGTYLREEIAKPLGLDLWFGLPESEFPRVAPVSDDTFMGPVIGTPTPMSGGLSLTADMRRAEVLATEIPWVNGVSNGRSLAGLFRIWALGGDADGLRLATPEQFQEINRISSASLVDATLMFPARWGLGFIWSVDNEASWGVGGSLLFSEDAWGHYGMGGQIGFADPHARLSFGYTTNKIKGLIFNECVNELVKATYTAIGYTQPSGRGLWARPGC